MLIQISQVTAEEDVAANSNPLPADVTLTLTLAAAAGCGSLVSMVRLSSNTAKPSQETKRLEMMETIIVLSLSHVYVDALSVARLHDADDSGKARPSSASITSASTTSCEDSMGHTRNNQEQYGVYAKGNT